MIIEYENIFWVRVYVHFIDVNACTFIRCKMATLLQCRELTTPMMFFQLLEVGSCCSSLLKAPAVIVCVQKTLFQILNSNFTQQNKIKARFCKNCGYLFEPNFACMLLYV